MEKHYSHKALFSLYLLLLLEFSSLSLLSSAYTPREEHFINCGSDSNVTVSGRNFVADGNSDSLTLSAIGSSRVKSTDTSTPNSPLYQTARIFSNPSSYEFQIVQTGTFVVRLHFYAFSSPNKLSDARFNVTASGYSLLSNFSVQNSGNYNSPVIKEFLLSINAAKYPIYFSPYQKSSFAFVNAIEIFDAPGQFIPNLAPHVTPAGNNGNYSGLLFNILKIVHRINVGGLTITPENSSTLWGNWVPDDDYLVNKDAAINSNPHSATPNYKSELTTQLNGVMAATEDSAPVNVYTTAKQLKGDDSNMLSFSNITWRFKVRETTTHLVRVHFCDIVSPTLNFSIFSFYIYSKFGLLVDPYNTFPQLAVPFYYNFVVDTDDSGFLNVIIAPRNDSKNQAAFLNGVEIMELIKDVGSVPTTTKPTTKHWLIIVGSVVGGVTLILILIMVVLFGLKCRKAKPSETSDWPAVPVYVDVGSSYSKISQQSSRGSPLPNLNLGLKVSFADLLYATNNFDTKLKIGEGGFGKVYKGTLRNHMRVAVKRSEPGHGQGLPEFQTEIMVLSKIRHRHLVSLIGYCDERSEMILVYEFMEKGTLRDHLYNLNEDSRRSSSSRSELDWNQRLEICIGAAKGLHYLHTSSDGGIIHRDVKSTNILLDEHYVAKVADFGLSRSGPPDQTYISTDVKGSFGYLDPEYYRCLQLTQKSDVYSFGVVLLEVLCARPAISRFLPRDQVNLADWGMSFQKEGQLEKIVDPFLEGKINPNSLRKFGEIVEKCLMDCGVDRPGMIDVLWDLEYALQLNQTTVLREPYEDSTVDASWKLPLHVVNRLPSNSITMDEDEWTPGMIDGSDTNFSNAGEVFSQLKVDDAR
ncbi:unnamed protein product [Ilex paraguariensis]|uniref:Protein kinase domain-containing protein n=1 Tax=Ilex paraguariensis TaxID=185542 RepID=A0ABC8QQL2_9AQUA